MFAAGCVLSCIGWLMSFWIVCAIGFCLLLPAGFFSSLWFSDRFAGQSWILSREGFPVLMLNHIFYRLGSCGLLTKDYVTADVCPCIKLYFFIINFVAYITVMYYQLIPQTAFIFFANISFSLYHSMITAYFCKMKKWSFTYFDLN